MQAATSAAGPNSLWLGPVVQGQALKCPKPAGGKKYEESTPFVCRIRTNTKVGALQCCAAEYCRHCQQLRHMGQNVHARGWCVRTFLPPCRSPSLLPPIPTHSVMAAAISLPHQHPVGLPGLPPGLRQLLPHPDQGGQRAGRRVWLRQALRQHRPQLHRVWGAADVRAPGCAPPGGAKRCQRTASVATVNAAPIICNSSQN
jgi:hypothetical protein